MIVIYSNNAPFPIIYIISVVQITFSTLEQVKRRRGFIQKVFEPDSHIALYISLKHYFHKKCIKLKLNHIIFRKEMK